MNKPQDKKHSKIKLILNGFVALVFVTMMLQDYVVYLIFHTSYFFSESLLFKINILLMFVTIFIYKPYSNISFKREINISKLLAYLVPISVIHIFIASLLKAFISHNFMSSPYTFWFLIQNKFTNDFVFMLTLYGLMYLIVRYYWLNIKPHVSKKMTRLSIKEGSKTTIISVDDIDWIAAETPYVGIWVGSNKYLYTSSLSKVLTELDNSNFTRIHRSSIVNRTKVKSMQSRANGDYDLLLTNGVVLRLSRNYKKNFKT